MHLQKSFFIVSCFLFLCSLSLNAQTDSLQGKSYEELIKLYDETIPKDANKAKIYATKAYKLAKNTLERKVLSKYKMAYAKYKQGLYAESIENLNEVIPLANQLDDNLLLFRIYNLKGNNLCDLNRNSEGFDQYIKAKKYAKLTKNPIHISTVDINIALIKKVHKDYQEGIDILLENLKLLNTLKNSNQEKLNNERIILMQLADTYLRINKPKEANQYNELAFSKCSKEKSPRLYYWILTNRAIIEYQNKNYQKSIETSKEVEAYFISIDKIPNLITPYHYLGKNYYQLKDYPNAIKYLEKAIVTSDRFQVDFPEREEVHKILHISYTEIGVPKKASEHFIKYSDLNEKNDSLDISLIKRMDKEIHVVPLQEEIDSLGSYTNYLYAASVVLFLALIGVFIWFKQKQQQNKIRFQELLVTIEQLEQDKKNTTPEVVVKEASNTVTDENALQILKKLAVFEEKELYLRQDCTLAYVAKKLKTNTSYLSNVINTYKEKSFKSYLSELRINAALIQLKNDDKLRSYTIKAIAEEFGFKRSETFSRAFKAQTNMYPSNYIKNLDNQYTT